MTRTRLGRSAATFWITALVSLGSGCTGTSGADDSCTPGTTRDCTCKTDLLELDGFQACKADGSRWNECYCQAGDSDTDSDIDLDIDTDADTDTDTDTVNCTKASDCPDGLSCHAAEGECGPCRVASECRMGESCNDGTCGDCLTSTECGGLLCDQGLCRSCVAPADDIRCRSDFEESDFSCQVDGSCGPDTCTNGVECQLTKRVCSESGRCIECGHAQDCLDPEYGGYAQGTLCIGGACVEANCAESSACPADRAGWRHSRTHSSRARRSGGGLGRAACWRIG